MNYRVIEIKPEEVVMLHNTNVKDVLVILNVNHDLKFYTYRNQTITEVYDKFKKSNISHYNPHIIEAGEKTFVQAYSAKYHTRCYKITFEHDWITTKIPNAQELGLPLR